MHIGIDARAYGWTGIGRYVRNLLTELAEAAERARASIPVRELVVFAPPRYARSLSSLPRTRVVPVRDSYYSLYEQTGFLKALLAERLDLLHFPNFNAPILYRRPSVVTVHDLTRFRFPGQRHRGPLRQLAYETVFRTAVQHARHVVAVSHFTKDRVLERFPAAASKISVVYQGVEERFFSPAGSGDDDVLLGLGIRRPYVLYVGLWMRHKNLPRLVEAFTMLRASGYSGTLVVTGEGRSWDEDVAGLVERAGVAPHIVLPGRVDDRALAALYRGADALAFPSLSEGFGLPPLEAMASGIPVVAARAGSLPEILGDAALFADPEKPAELAAALQLVISDAVVRAQLVRRGRERASGFSWRRTAQQTLAVYERALGALGPS